MNENCTIPPNILLLSVVLFSFSVSFSKLTPSKSIALISIIVTSLFVLNTMHINAKTLQLTCVTKQTDNNRSQELKWRFTIKNRTNFLWWRKTENEKHNQHLLMTLRSHYFLFCIVRNWMHKKFVVIVEPNEIGWNAKRKTTITTDNYKNRMQTFQNFGLSDPFNHKL